MTTRSVSTTFLAPCVSKTFTSSSATPSSPKNATECELPLPLSLYSFFSFLDRCASRSFFPRSIYKDIIVPLARAWSHPNIFQVLRPHLCVFASHVSVAVPVSSLLSLIYHRSRFFPFLPRPLRRLSLKSISGPPSASLPCSNACGLTSFPSWKQVTSPGTRSSSYAPF